MYKTPTGPKPLRIRFHKRDGFIISLDSIIKHLILFDYGLFNNVCDKIKYLISKRIGIANIVIIIFERSELIHIILIIVKEYDICHYWYLLNYSFKFQRNVCNRYHDLLMMSIKLSDVAILNINYRCVISLISKNEAINLMENADLTETSGSCIKVSFHI